jgi:uncharacterized protein GlcG (DUF336 family)
MSKLLMAAAATVLLAGFADAQPRTPPAKGPPAALAEEAVVAATETCKASGYSVAAVVLDSSGAPKAVLVGDGAPAVVATFAQRKAATALAFNKTSGEVGEAAKTDAFLAEKIQNDPKLIGWAGGLPISAKGELIGAIGVGGAPGGDKDEVCAKAALAKIADRLN